MINLNLSVSPELAADEAALRREINSALPPQSKSYKDYRIIHRSIDARSRNVKIHLIIEVFGPEENILEPSSSFQFYNARSDRQVVIAGAGPAGLFAALKLLEAGIKPLIVERGKRIRNRRRDIAALTRNHIVNPDSNYCFGEGGAGTFSDGKLYTRSKKRGDFLKILQLLVQHGAGDEILADARPHIGTNKLPEIIENIREVILKHGGEIFFETRVVDIIITGGAVSSVVVQSVTDGIQNELITGDFILATGHSARDIYELLHRKSILMEPKPFAMGVRIEHPQPLIDGIQYHSRRPL